MTTVYLDGPVQSEPNLQAHAQSLLDMGFAVSRSEPGSALFKRFADLAMADVSVFLVAGQMPARLYALAAYALASGLRVIAVGSVKHIPEDVRQLFILQVDSWDELAQDQFLKLGEVRFKKLRLK